MSTLPSVPSWSSRIGVPKVRPASLENAAKALGLPSLAWNHAAAALRPRALSEGPFTGQAGKTQPSSAIALGSVHLPFSSRVTTMSRTSVADRSRYATIGPSDVTATLVGQHSHTRRSSAASPDRFQFL